MKWLAVVALLGAAQAPAAFDVASVKPSGSLDSGGFMRLMPGGGITAHNMRARTLITAAYQIQQFQLIDAPNWTRDTKYDVVAKPASRATREQIFPMLQALLADRFKLAVHHETRRVTGYALVRIRADVLGPDLKVSDADCAKAFTSTPRCREGGITAGTMKMIGVPVWSVLQVLIGQLAAPVSDETGLSGTYDVDLKWSNDPAATGDLPSMFTAVQEQLGLKLEKRSVATDVVVVDHIERPGPD